MEPLVSPRHIVAQQQEEPDSDSSGVQDLDRLQDYTLVRRESHRITPTVRCGF